MRIFAHRGWSEGEVENTLAGFRKSIEAMVDGVEFDVRYGADGMTVVLSHDITGNSATLSLDEALSFLVPTEVELLIEFKEYSDDFFVLVIQHLRKYNLVSRTTLFAFPEVAKVFPWGLRNDIKLGIIAPYPRDIKKYITMYSPDMVFLGWGNKKERMKFRLAWAVLSLARTFAKYRGVKFVIGVAYTQKDKTFFSRQAGLYGMTADFPLRQF